MQERTPAHAALPPSEYPGGRLGLPETGPRSIGRAGRRIAALAIDYACAAVLAFGFFDYDATAILMIFAAVQFLFVPTIGGSPGHRILGLRVVALRGGWVGIWRPLVRAVLVTLVIPAVIWDSDQRGFHDKLAGTALVRNP